MRRMCTFAIRTTLVTAAACIAALFVVNAASATAAVSSSTTSTGQFTQNGACQYYNADAAATAPSVGVSSLVVVSTSPSPGFQELRVRANVRLAPGDYVLWIAKLDRAADGTIVGCSLTGTSFTVTKSSGTTKVTATATAYTGTVEEQSFINVAGGNFDVGFATEPELVVIP